MSSKSIDAADQHRLFNVADAEYGCLLQQFDLSIFFCILARTHLLPAWRHHWFRLMTLATSFSLGVSLSMDAFAASIAQGAQSKGARLRQALRTALYFGTFEALTPVIGWTLGLLIGSAMARIDHWVAFSLLLLIGLKMIRDAVRSREKASATPGVVSGRLALVAFSTSIDAAAVGVTLVVMQIPIITAALIIGATTFAFTCVGFMLGGLAGKRLPRFAEGAGGLLLIGIGAKILFSHIVLGY